MNILERLLNINLDRADDRNAWFLVVEIFWASILAGAAAFNSAYALRLGASNTAIGLLSSIPALLAIMISIPSGRFLQSCNPQKPWILASLIITRVCYLGLAFIPWLFIGNIPQGNLLVAWLILLNIPAIFFNIGFTPMLAEVIPETRRAAVFTARNVVSSGAVSVLTFVAGIWLKRIVFPANYQALYAIGFIASMISTYTLAKVKVPASFPPPILIKKKKAYSFKNRLVSFRNTLTEYPEFLRITRNTFFYGIGLWTAGPLYILYFVRSLGAGEAWIGTNATVASLSVIFGYTFFRWVISRLGEPRTLRYSMLGAGIYPLLIGLFPSLPVIWFFTAVNNFIASGISLSHINTFLKIIPADSKPLYFGIYTTIVNIGAFICPLIGVWFANQFGFQSTLIGCGIVAILGSISFSIWPVTLPKRMVSQESPVPR